MVGSATAIMQQKSQCLIVKRVTNVTDSVDPGITISESSDSETVDEPLLQFKGMMCTCTVSVLQIITFHTVTIIQCLYRCMNAVTGYLTFAVLTVL